MYFTDIFIKRPVLSIVVSLIILILGIKSIFLLPVRKYPELTNAIITVTTVYPGASAELIAGFITTPLEKAISTAEGIDYIQSSSMPNVSNITINLKLNYDTNDALSQIIAKINSIKSELPKEAEEPVINVRIGENIASMYLSFYSDVMDSNQITDYLTRVVRPKLLTVEGVQDAEIIGARKFAMRIWLNPDKMTAYNIQPADVWRALSTYNFTVSLGKTKGTLISVYLDSNSQINTEVEFGNIILKQDNTKIVRLKDIAEINLSAEDFDTYVSFDGREATFIGIHLQPKANPLVVNKNVWRIFPEIKDALPEGLIGKIVYDSSRYIYSSIKEVIKTLIEAIIIVIVVIYLFLGSIKVVSIPAVTIPLSLIGGAIIMLILGYSINLLTLLSMVLAIGLVVDDAIIVLENSYRHIQEGKDPLTASSIGIREIFLPVIATTLTIGFVYLPIGFLGGLTGQLFSEFAFTLVGCVVVSTIIAIVLSPMMCSKILSPSERKSWLVNRIETDLDRLKNVYTRALRKRLPFYPVYVYACVVILFCSYVLYKLSPKELAPLEDQGFFLIAVTGDSSATTDQMIKFTQPLKDIVFKYDGVSHYFNIVGLAPTGGIGLNNSGIAGVILKPWHERDTSQKSILESMQHDLASLPGVMAAAFPLPSLPGAGTGLPVQFVVTSTATPEEMLPLSEQFLERAKKSGLFFHVESNLKINLPSSRIIFDRDKIASLGLSPSDVGHAISQVMSGAYVNRFDIQGYNYKVIPQVERNHRLNPEQLLDYHIKTPKGEMIPLKSLISIQEEVKPEQIIHFQQLNSFTIGAVPGIGTTLGKAYEFFTDLSKELLPPGYFIDFAGEIRQYVKESQDFLITFVFSVVIIYLVLAAQFESFRDPLIIITTVPLSTCGALIFINLGLATINIYTQVGLVTLVGLATKNGILIVQFANQLQREGLNKLDAIIQASATRLRPILMTTASTVIGIMPLLFATGAGAASRFNIGLVITTGLTIGTFFTLFIVPAVYMLVARDFNKKV